LPRQSWEIALFSPPPVWYKDAMLPKFVRTVPGTHRPNASFEDLVRITEGMAGRTSAGAEADVREVIVRGIAAIADAGPEQVTWVKGHRHARAIAMSKAGVVIVPEGFGAMTIPAIVVKDVEFAIVRVLAYFEPARERPMPGVHPSAVVADDASIDPTAAIGAHARIGQGVRIGERTAVHGGAHLAAGASVGRDCVIGENVYVGDRCRIGNRVVIKPGAVIGSNGFGFHFRDGRHVRIPQIGIVVLEDDVEIGANACVDRAKVATTLIGRGSKIDNLVQVAHNCTLGPLCIVAAQTGMSGSTRVGTGVVFAGQAASTHDVTIASGVRLGGRAVATKDILEPGDYLGYPAQPENEYKRQTVAQRRLPELLETIKDLTRRVADLEAAARTR